MPVSAGDRLVVIAHRGGSELFHENTVTAFRKAQDLGVDAIELDVNLTKDGKLAVIHDPDLNRIAGIDRMVSDMTMAELSSVELEGGERIPSLDDVFREVSVPLVIELKSFETYSALTELFDANPEYVGRCAVISFFHAALLKLKEKYPDLTTGALLAGLPVDPASVAVSCRSEMLALNFEGVNREYVDLCHMAGVRVTVWTPNTEKELRTMVDAGVDSIATDRPDILLRILGRNRN